MKNLINVLAWIAWILNCIESTVRALTEYDEYRTLPIMMLVVFWMVWEMYNRGDK